MPFVLIALFAAFLLLHGGATDWRSWNKESGVRRPVGGLRPRCSGHVRTCGDAKLARSVC